MKHYIVAFIISVCLSANAAWAAPSSQDANMPKEHAHHGEHQSDHTRITTARAQQAGITTAVAAAGSLLKTITVYGRITTTPDHVSQISARFAGVVTGVRATIGDKVKVGEVLASIESNDSLQTYQLRSPIAGVVTERHANRGESTEGRVLFSVSNLAVLWADLKIFPSQRARVSAGDKVTLSTDTLSQKTSLRHLVPNPDGQPFVLARAEINNRDNRWTPGLLVKGHIQTGRINAALVIPQKALQTHEGEPVVFVVEGNKFIAQPVSVGRRDKQQVEIVAGLKTGETYVVNNSYLIKADMEKSGAEHSH